MTSSSLDLAVIFPAQPQELIQYTNTTSHSNTLPWVALWLCMTISKKKKIANCKSVKEMKKDNRYVYTASSHLTPILDLQSFKKSCKIKIQSVSIVQKLWW